MVDFVCYGRGDARTLDLYDFAKDQPFFYDQTATSFKVAYGGNNVTEFEGYGFQYDPQTGAPIAGTTTYGLRSVNGDPFGLITGVGITMEQAAVYIASDPQAVNRDVFKGNDRITGSIFADYLDGWAGADYLSGGAGNDTYVVDNVGDRVIEASGAGKDTVLSSVGYTLKAGQEIETLQLFVSTGSANLNLTGNEFAQSLIGNNGANVINGGAGLDVMTGRGGNDTYYVDNIGDRVVEAAGGGRDTVLTSASYALAAGQEIEVVQMLVATGSAALNLTGNEFAQSLTGNTGANLLDGKGGADVLTGRGGADSFQFSTALSSANVDRIVDFAAEDTIRLAKSVFAAIAPGQLADGAFKSVAVVATAPLDADDRILYKSSTGELFYDADGSGAAAAVKFAVLDNKAALTAADFLIV